jgi:hypothetical protein
MVRYSFLVRLLHPLLSAGLDRRFQDVPGIQKGLVFSSGEEPTQIFTMIRTKAKTHLGNRRLRLLRYARNDIECVVYVIARSAATKQSPLA